MTNITENKFNVKVGDIVKVKSLKYTYSFDPSIGEVIDTLSDYGIFVKIISAQNHHYMNRESCTWFYRSIDVIEVVSRAEKTKPNEHRITNEHDICLLATINTPNGKEVSFDFYPTDDELEEIVIAAIKNVFECDDKQAKILLSSGDMKHWVKLLDSYIDGRLIEQVIGNTDLYELWYQEEYGEHKRTKNKNS